MAQLAIAREFLTEYARLERPVRRAVEQAISKFQEHTNAGLHLERVRNSRDPRIRTIRIDKFWRGVVLAPESGDVYCLLRVLPHDDAYAYCQSRRFTVNQRLGVLESRDELQLETMEPALRKAADAADRRLFDGIRDSDLKRLGIDEDVLPIIRLLTREDHLEALQKLLPAVQYDALLALASGMTVEEAWAEVSKNLVDPVPPERVDPDDLTTAMARTPERVVFVEGPEELTRILAHPFDVWRVFLHPQQRRIAYRDEYKGPAMVTGGAGTGKTVTAVHRAAFLARRYQSTMETPILLTTYGRDLTDALRDQVALLVDDPEIRDRIEVATTDRISFRVIKEAQGGRAPEPLTDTDLRNRWNDEAAELGLPYSGTFLLSEWEQVVLAQRLTTEQAYVACDRRGRGKRLPPGERPEVWRAIQTIVAHMRRDGVWSFKQMADEAARILDATDRRLYRHIIVDEAQDLHPAQWRLLRAAVPDAPNDLFIVGDPHQRIYDNRVSLQSLGIKVRGRSRKLTVSYRTTHEILSWAVRVLDAGIPVTGMDDIEDTLAGYGSPMHGRRPVVRRFPDRDAELDALVAQVRSWMSDGVEPKDIGVAARRNDIAEQVKRRLKAAGVPAYAPSAKTNGVKAGSMHKMKGLEFRCMAVVGVDEDLIPLMTTVPAEEDDPTAHEQALQRERCLLFVACTRARDALYVSHTGRPSPFLPR
ncbi:DNA helicase [Actinomadura rubrobrunea]|uniref:DNA 3'-5' helicase n=1 Tax=Actinomadura rubrobrunea TaxID=115335 RepID=A0A9W6PSP3_9ACTN|nr:UvrD-helicase domain-containing protein [Actinomadura rubrobrunea]GLW62172.1 DNA helicase [Actinomadura rubrobrunea]